MSSGEEHRHKIIHYRSIIVVAKGLSGGKRKFAMIDGIGKLSARKAKHLHGGVMLYQLCPMLATLVFLSFLWSCLSFPLAPFPFHICPSFSPSHSSPHSPPTSTTPFLHLYLLRYVSPLPQSLPPPVLSPPMSPGHGGDEAAHVKATLEGVFHTQEVGQEAVAKLCSHVKADPQEQQVEHYINVQSVLTV